MSLKRPAAGGESCLQDSFSYKEKEKEKCYVSGRYDEIFRSVQYRDRIKIPGGISLWPGVKKCKGIQCHERQTRYLEPDLEISKRNGGQLHSSLDREEQGIAVVLPV